MAQYKKRMELIKSNARTLKLSSQEVYFFYS